MFLRLLRHWPWALVFRIWQELSNHSSPPYCWPLLCWLQRSLPYPSFLPHLNAYEIFPAWGIPELLRYPELPSQPLLVVTVHIPLPGEGIASANNTHGVHSATPAPPSSLLPQQQAHGQGRGHLKSTEKGTEHWGSSIFFHSFLFLREKTIKGKQKDRLSD